jgi:hypothetical protein
MAAKQKVNEKMNDALGLANVPEPALTPVIVPAEVVFTGNADEDMQVDFQLARKALHHLAEKSTTLADKATHFAAERQDPQSVAAACQAQKEARDSILAVMNFHKTRKDIERASEANKKPAGDNITHQNVFFGTATELLQMMKDMKDLPATKLIDVEKKKK